MTRRQVLPAVLKNSRICHLSSWNVLAVGRRSRSFDELREEDISEGCQKDIDFTRCTLRAGASAHSPR